MIATQYIEQGYPPGQVLKAAGLGKGAYYYRNRDGAKGARPSTHTRLGNGSFVTNEIVVADIEELLQKEFVDYGYIKVTHWLRRNKRYLINFKKVYRLMREHKLLNQPVKRDKTGKKWVKYTVPTPEMPFNAWELDIKYIFIHGEKRNALLLTVIDVMTRLNMGWTLNWNIRKEQVKELLSDIFTRYIVPLKVSIRNDNGSQFESKLVREYLREADVDHEFTRPATPQQNGHIESYHSIIERTICTRYEFDSLEHAKDVFARFVCFYNQERIHSGIDYQSPVSFLNEHKINYIVNQKIITLNTGETETGNAGGQPARDNPVADGIEKPLLSGLAETSPDKPIFDATCLKKTQPTNLES